MGPIKKALKKLSSFFNKKQDPSGKSNPEELALSTKEVMSTIYKDNLWGGKSKGFYSGQGSHKQKIVEPYLVSMTNWLSSFDEKLIVCDLGCGDFNVGKQLVPYAQKYVGVDIVDDLIARNKEVFKGENLEFHCLDIVKDELPKADCVFIRQVFQHLSNEAIATVLEKLRAYKYLIVTEHLPFGSFTPNTDKPTGAGIRLSKKSGVVLTEPPFNLTPLVEKELLSINFRSRSKIDTILYQNF